MTINFIEFQLFSLIIILQIFYKIGSSTSFDYPYSITLPNDNIFLIQKTGIDIYDKSLNKLNQIIEFSGKEEISEEKFAKIAIKYNYEYILSVINDKMLIFNNEGKLLYKSEEKINDKQIIYSYSLTFINVTNNYFDYILGYFDKECYLKLYLYRYDIENNNITELSKKRNDYYYYDKMWSSYSYYTNLHKLLSCEYMYHTYSKNNLVCFFNDDPYIGIVYYEIENSYNNKIYINKVEIVNYHLYSNIGNDIKNITSIKSEINNNGDLAIIWWNYKGNKERRYFIYKISDESYSHRSSDVRNTCINEEYGTINIFQTKNQIAFSCVIQDKFVQVLLYNKSDLNSTYDFYMLYASCENINGLSRLYYNDNKNYYIHSCFKDCSDKNYENDIYCLNIKREEEIKKRKIIIAIIIIIFIILLLIASIFIYRIYMKNKFERNWKKGQEDEKAMKDIMTDLLPNNQ